MSRWLSDKLYRNGPLQKSVKFISKCIQPFKKLTFFEDHGTAIVHKIPDVKEVNMPDFDIKVKDENGVIVVTTNGYLNNYGGEQVASVCLQKISEGKRKFLINVEKTAMVNSIGVSILIEVIEELQGTNGKIAFCNTAPIVEKTFNIMGISKYAKIYASEEEGLADLSA